MNSNEIIEIYGQQKYKEAAEELLSYYESANSIADSNIWNKFGRSDIVQRLGYEMSKNPEMARRLGDVAPRVLSSERIHLLWLVPSIMEKIIPEDKIWLYKRQLNHHMEVFGTDNLEGIVKVYDEANRMKINSK